MNHDLHDVLSPFLCICVCVMSFWFAFLFSSVERHKSKPASSESQRKWEWMTGKTANENSIFIPMQELHGILVFEFPQGLYLFLTPVDDSTDFLTQGFLVFQSREFQSCISSRTFQVVHLSRTFQVLYFWKTEQSSFRMTSLSLFLWHSFHLWQQKITFVSRAVSSSLSVSCIRALSLSQAISRFTLWSDEGNRKRKSQKEREATWA